MRRDEGHPRVSGAVAVEIRLRAGGAAPYFKGPHEVRKDGGAGYSAAAAAAGQLALMSL